jgi:serine/threonine-protein kinase RsbW
MRYSPTASDSSEPRAALERSSRLYCWDLNPPLLRRFLRETGLEAWERCILPAGEMPGDAASPAPLIVAAADAGEAPAPPAARPSLETRALLILPRCDERLWRRLVRRGWLDVLEPPFASEDPERLFAREPEGLALARRSPELESRLSARLQLKIPAEPKQVAPAAALLSRLARELGFPPRVWAENLPLALDEALCNAVEHGCGGDASREVEIELLALNDVLRVKISDPGPGFDPEALESPVEGEALHRPGGRGVLLMRALMDRVEFADGGRVVKLYARRRPPA